MSIKIALIGNPNCGKTTLFNALTGAKQKVGNWAGVTVEEKLGKFCKNKNVEVVDLPGIYSIHPFTPEEKVSSSFLKKSKPNAIINVVSAVNLERSLYLTLQLLELKIPIIVAISMVDVLEKQGGEFNFEEFSKIFHCEAVPIFKNNKPNNFTALELAIAKTNQPSNELPTLLYSKNVENCLNEVASILKLSEPVSSSNLRTAAIEFLESNIELNNASLSEEQQLKIKNSIKTLTNNLNDKNNIQNVLVSERYNFIINNINKFMVKKPSNNSTISNKIDKILTNKWLAFPMFILIISIIYFVSIPLIGKPISSWLDEVLLKNWLIPGANSILTKLSIQFWLKNLICNGILSGVGSVLVFVPQLFLLFFMLCFLEECGYMSRVTFITDKLFNKFGLCGQSIISFLVSSSCGVNGIVATKTIKNPTIRLTTIIATTFIPCSAKIPIIATISSLFLANGWLIAPIAYLICITAILACGLFFKTKQTQSQRNSGFFMEILPYQMPSLKHMFLDALLNIKSFISKAVTVILIASILIWTATNVGLENSKIVGIVQPDKSFLAQIGRTLAPIFKPLGFSNWQAIAASISGLFAKENIVNTLEVISASNAKSTSSIAELFNNGACAFSFLIFNLLCAPCCVAIAAVFKQTNSLKLTFKVAAFQTMIAFGFSAISFLVAQLFI